MWSPARIASNLKHHQRSTPRSIHAGAADTKRHRGEQAGREMMPAVASRREQLHRWALRLEYFTVGWNIVEGWWRLPPVCSRGAWR
jgi:hypothetical protein